MKNNYLSTMLFIAIVCLSFHVYAQTPKAATELKLPAYFYKRLEGAIGQKHVIEMDLIRLDSTLKGTYYYKNTNRAVELTGTVNNEGKFFLKELGKFDPLTNSHVIIATFQGEFISDTEIKGRWERMKRDTTLIFHLKENYPAESARFELIKKTKGYGTCESGSCAKFEIIYPLMKSGLLKDKINKELMTTVIAKYEHRSDKVQINTYDELIADFVARYRAEESNYEGNSDAKPVWGHYNELQIVFNASYILSVQLTSETSESGSRPVTAVHFQNYDMSTGKKIKLDDLFSPGYESHLREIAERIFRNNYGLGNESDLRNEGFNFPNGKFVLNNNFKLNKKGITFQYNLYEIASYSMGAPEIFIPYTQLRNIIRSDGLLRFTLGAD